MPHLSQYHTLYITVREMRIWPPNATKYCKNTGKFFPNVRQLRVGISPPYALNPYNQSRNVLLTP